MNPTRFAASRPFTLPSELDSVRDALDPHSREFLQRMLEGGPRRYLHRLEAIGFTGLGSVLDAGCGFGQWTLALAQFNRQVSGIDVRPERIAVAKALSEGSGVENVRFASGSVESLPYRSGVFDAVFCYSVVYATDYRRTLAELARVLKPGGQLYINTNGPGWALYNLIESHHPAANFHPRRYAIKLMRDTVRYAVTGRRQDDAHVIMFPAQTARLLYTLGFERVALGGDGELHVTGRRPGERFYTGQYLGLPNVFEVLATRRGDRR